MLCRECHTFRGTPYCGACRALTRVKVLLTEGHLREEQEAAVLGILRDTSGALQDLAEANRGQPSREPRDRVPSLERSRVRATPRPERERRPAEAPEVRDPVPAEVERRAEDEGSSYIEESEEEEAPAEEEPAAEVEREGPALPRAHGSLGRALELRPTGKASAANSRAASLRRTGERHNDRPQEEVHNRPEGGDHREGNREGRHRERKRRSRGPRSPDHPPAHHQGERKRKRSRSKRKKSKGKAKRERGRVWRDNNFRQRY